MTEVEKAVKKLLGRERLTFGRPEINALACIVETDKWIPPLTSGLQVICGEAAF